MVSVQLTTTTTTVGAVPAAAAPPTPRLAYYSLNRSIKARCRCRCRCRCRGVIPNPNLKACLTLTTRASSVSSLSEEDEDNDNDNDEIVMWPKHVAIIMDGNGRWAEKRKLPVREGHRAGWQRLTSLISHCCHLPIHTLTVFAFSTDNWKRSKMEVDYLMTAFENYLQSQVKELIARHNIRFSAIGNRTNLAESLQSAVCLAEERSVGNKGLHLVMALNYSGRDDVVEAVKKIARNVERGIVGASDVDESMVEEQLMTNILEFPNPDLLIRTSGELRISNFLLWQLAYTEFYFQDTLFPDFDETHLLQAFSSYQRRHRRFGKRIH